MSNDKDNSTDKIIAAKKGNVVVDLDLITSDDDNAEFIMLDSDEGNEILRHSSAHIMAQAVLEIFPEALFTICLLYTSPSPRD